MDDIKVMMDDCGTAAPRFDAVRDASSGNRLRNRPRVILGPEPVRRVAPDTPAMLKLSQIFQAGTTPSISVIGSVTCQCGTADFMEGIKYDRSSWNLDFLALKGPIREVGDVRHYAIGGDGVTLAVAFADPRSVLSLNSDSNSVSELNLDTGTSHSLFSFEEPCASDMAVSGNRAYLLFPARQLLRIVLLGPIRDLVGFKPTCFDVDVASLQIGNCTRVVVLKYRSADNATIVLAPLKEDTYGVISYRITAGQLHLIELEERKLECATSFYRFGASVGLAADLANRSVIVADTSRHQIVEVEIQTGKSRVLAGTGQAGLATEGTDPEEAKLNCPSVVALYRPKEVISAELLSRASCELLKRDATGVRPRTLLIGDSGNFSVKKLIELPKSPLETRLNGFRGIFTLLGPACAPSGEPCPQPPELGAPLDAGPIAVSSTGAVIMAIRSSQNLLLLQPATAKTSLTIESVTRLYSGGET